MRRKINKCTRKSVLNIKKNNIIPSFLKYRLNLVMLWKWKCTGEDVSDPEPPSFHLRRDRSVTMSIFIFNAIIIYYSVENIHIMLAC